MKAIADSGPLIHLAAVSQFGLLRRYFAELQVPPSVFQEVVVVGSGQPGSRETEMAAQSGWLTIALLPEPALVASWLRQGLSSTDAAVLALAQEHPGHILLADDRVVRTTALAAGLQVYGTIGLLIDGKRDGHLSTLQPVLDQLIASGFYLDPGSPLYQEALRLAGEA